MVRLLDGVRPSPFHGTALRQSLNQQSSVHSPKRGARPGCRNDPNVRFSEGFKTPAVTNTPTRRAAGVWKPPKGETAGRGTY
jgi:hypothetical protein